MSLAFYPAVSSAYTLQEENTPIAYDLHLELLKMSTAKLSQSWGYEV